MFRDFIKSKFELKLQVDGYCIWKTAMIVSDWFS